MIIDFNQTEEDIISKGIFADLDLENKIHVINEKFKGINLNKDTFLNKSSSFTLLKFICFLSAIFLLGKCISFRQDKYPTSSAGNHDFPTSTINSLDDSENNLEINQQSAIDDHSALTLPKNSLNKNISYGIFAKFFYFIKNSIKIHGSVSKESDIIRNPGINQEQSNTIRHAMSANVNGNNDLNSSGQVIERHNRVQTSNPLVSNT
jgi:hypothetical protein